MEDYHIYIFYPVQCARSDWNKFRTAVSRDAPRQSAHQVRSTSDLFKQTLDQYFLRLSSFPNNLWRVFLSFFLYSGVHVHNHKRIMLATLPSRSLCCWIIKIVLFVLIASRIWKIYWKWQFHSKLKFENNQVFPQHVEFCSQFQYGLESFLARLWMVGEEIQTPKHSPLSAHPKQSSPLQMRW